MTEPWKPSVTVAAVIERDGRFLLVEEDAGSGACLNQPAGHLEAGESLLDAVAREVLEETAHAFTPAQLVGVYLWRAEADAGSAITYLRFAFIGEVGSHDAGRPLDAGILRTLWLTRDEIAARRAEHRSPLVQRCVDDYLSGQRYPLDLLFTHPSAVAPGVAPVVAPAKAGAQSAASETWVPAAACLGRQEAGAGATKAK